MKTPILDLWGELPYPGECGDGFRPTLDVYLLKSTAPRPAVLIFPGSGYAQCSDREAEAVALQMNAAGYHAFVLWYSCAPHSHPAPLLDAARAMTVIRSRAAEWDIRPDRVAALGFSAGAHLVETLAQFWALPEAACEGIDPSLSRPDRVVLCYPVVTSGEFAHRGSFDCLLGDKKDDPDLLRHLSMEEQVTSDFPPAFVWSTWNDDAVPIENTLRLLTRLRAVGVSVEAHIFPDGRHGISLATAETCGGEEFYVKPRVAVWMDLCRAWLADQLA